MRALRRPLGGDAGGAELAVIGVRPEADDPQLAVFGDGIRSLPGGAAIALSVRGRGGGVALLALGALLFAVTELRGGALLPQKKREELDAVKSLLSLTGRARWRFAGAFS